MAGNYYFVMVAPGDRPVFEAEFGPHAQPSTGSDKKEDHRHLNQFIVHAALDAVEETMWTTPLMQLKTVDKFNDWMVSAFITAGQIKLMLLHDIKNDDGIKNFFTDIHELYVKVVLNPFYEVGAKITSADFAQKVKQCAKKNL